MFLERGGGGASEIHVNFSVLNEISISKELAQRDILACVRRVVHLSETIAVKVFSTYFRKKKRKMMGF